MNNMMQIMKKGFHNGISLNDRCIPCESGDDSQAAWMDPQLIKESPEELFQQALWSENEEDAILLLSLAVYLRHDYLPALFHRSMAYFNSGDYNLALMDIQRCRDLDLDNILYERWEEVLFNLVIQ